MLAAGESVVLARDPQAFAIRYGAAIEIVGPFDGGKLANGGERIALVDWQDTTIFDFEYDDGGAWPGRADGNGSSLELVEPNDVPGNAAGRLAHLETPAN